MTRVNYTTTGGKLSERINDVKKYRIDVDELQIITVTGFDKKGDTIVVAKGNAGNQKAGEEVLVFCAEPFIMKAVIESGTYGVERQIYLLERLSRKMFTEDSDFIYNNGYDNFDYSILKAFPRLAKNMRVWRLRATAARHSSLGSVLKSLFN